MKMFHRLPQLRLPAVVLGVATLLGTAVLLGGAGDDSAAREAMKNGALRHVPNEAYGYGEKLVFDVNYKFVTVGQAVMQIGNKPVTVGGRPTYEVKFDVTTTPSFDKVFKVRDRYRTYIDVDGAFPWRFEQSVREGKYSRDFAAIIDQREHKAKTTDGSFSVPPFVHDILSAFYYTRTVDLGRMSKGQQFRLKNFYGKQSYDLAVKVLGTERVKVDAGTFDCVVVEPLVKEGGLFKSEGRILVWLSNDDRKIPVKVVAKVPIGGIEGKLKSYSGTRGPVTARR